MSWFKENKFLGGLIAVTLLLAVALIAFGISAKGKKEATLEEIEAAKATLKRQQSIDPFPNPANVKAKKANLREVVDAANETQKAFLTYAPEAMANVSAAEFQAKFEKTEQEVESAFEEARVEFPEEFALGFETYKGGAPREAATGTLLYQLDAFKALFMVLADAGVAQIDNFYRGELPIESAPPAAPTGKKRSSRPGRRNKGPVGPTLPEVAERFPFELTFSAREEKVREVLTKIANHEEYFFVIKALRINNSAKIPDNKGLAFATTSRSSSKPKSDGQSLFGGDDTPAAEEEEEPAAGGRILQRVAGGEDLKVFLRADLLLFKKDVAFPEVK